MSEDDGNLPRPSLHPAAGRSAELPAPLAGAAVEVRTTADPPAQVAAALVALRRAVDVLAGADPASLSGWDAIGFADDLAVATSRLTAARVRLLPTIEADGLWAVDGASSFPVWVAHRHRVPVHTARTQVHLGRTLRDHLPRTTHATTTGQISVDHAHVLAAHTPTTPQRRAVLADTDHEVDETFLVQQAARLGVDQTRVLARRWAAAVDPDADDDGHTRASDREHLYLSRVGDLYRIDGQLTIDHGHALTTALTAVTPVPAADDTRTRPQRRAQALADLARLTLDHDLVPTGRTARPHITVLIDEPRLRALLDATDRRATPAPHRTSPYATADLLTGHDIAGSPQYQDGTPIPRTVLDRLACDCAINRVIFGPDSHVLDVGRTERTFTGSRRTALIARDKHCQYPTCTAPPVLCEGHHIRHWARDHGTTRITNGILLCYHHHDLVHRTGIAIHRRHHRWAFTDRHGHPLHPDHDETDGVIDTG